MTLWQQLSFCNNRYEFEYDQRDYTGWYRCIGGRLADGRWPEWNYRTSEKRYS